MENRLYKSSNEYLYLEEKHLHFTRRGKKLSKSDNILTILRAASNMESKQSGEPQFYKTKPPSQHEAGEARVDEIKSLTSYNEMIVYLLDNLPGVNNFFNVPIVEDNQLASYQTVEEENTSIGTYANLIHEANSQGVSKEVLDSGFDIFEAQKFVIFQLLIKAEDTHGGNIIIQVNAKNQLVPIPIDFGRCLGNNPSDEHMLPRTTRWEQWPALLYPIDEKIKTFFLGLDVDTTISTIRNEFFKLLEHVLSNEMLSIFEKKFSHLEANLLMIKEAIKKGLTTKQMLALILPAINTKSFQFVTQGVLQGGELWPARSRFATLETAFTKAWYLANEEESFNKEVFYNCIAEEINEIKKIPENILEKRYFDEMSYELRRGLYL